MKASRRRKYYWHVITHDTYKTALALLKGDLITSGDSSDTWVKGSVAIAQGNYFVLDTMSKCTKECKEWYNKEIESKPANWANKQRHYINRAWSRKESTDV